MLSLSMLPYTSFSEIWSFLVTVLLLCRNTKAPSKRKHLVGGLLTISEAESRAIVSGSMTAVTQAWHWRSS